MQLLYQLDVRGFEDAALIREGLVGGHDDADVCDQAFGLALAAWSSAAEADALATRLATEWPTHRQPPVDRALLRLAYHEMRSEHAPVRVAINEAVELAKQYGSQQSPAFINGVLDRMAKRIETDRVAASPGEAGEAMP